MESVTLNTSVIVMPDALGPLLYETIKKQVNAKYLKRCTEKEGIITKVYEPVKVLSNTVLRDNKAIQFNVSVSVDRILPVVGMVVPSQVVTIISNGLFFNYHSLCILVPKSTFKGEFCSTPTAHFVLDGRRIGQGDVLLVRITKCQWSPPVVPPNALASKAAATPQGKFTVIGELVI